MLEAILGFSIRHRHLVVICTLAAALASVHALARLPIDAVPDITANQVVVSTIVPAMSPEQIEKEVTVPIESALAGIQGLESTRSETRNGFSQITAVFDDSVPVYFARQQVSERLGGVRAELPPDAEPIMGAVTTGLSGVYVWAVVWGHPDGKGAPIDDGHAGWQSDGSYLTPEGEKLTTETERLAYLRTVEDWIIRPQIKQVPDVAEVDEQGGYVKQYQVQPDPMKLVQYGVSFADLLLALQKNNVATGAGYVDRRGESYIVRADARVHNVVDIGRIVLAQRNGTPIQIQDVAAVAIGGEMRYGAASANGSECVAGTALMLIGANSRTVAAAVDQRMRQINLPPDVVVKTVLNRTHLVDATIHTVVENLFLGAILVIVVLLLLLGSIRAALIVALAIPISMLLTAGGMVASKVSGNLMSLGAIDFGLIVDGAVIIVENCMRLIALRQQELGRTLTIAERLEVVGFAAAQVRKATVFGEAIIIIVYLPILTLHGVEGRMFWPMAMTVVLALVAAFVLSLTFVPAMVAICIRGRVSERENPLIKLARIAYQPVLALALRRRWMVAFVSLILFGVSILLFNQLGQTFIPKLDEGDIDILSTRMPSISLADSMRLQEALEDALKPFPEVEFVMSIVGTGDQASDPMPYSQGDALVSLKPRSQWPNPNESKNDLVIRIGDALSKVPGMTNSFTQPIEDRFNDLTVGVRSEIAIHVFGDDFKIMIPAANKIVDTLYGVRGAADIQIDQIEGLPVMDITPRWAEAARFGLDAAQINDVISIAVGGKPAGYVYDGDRSFELAVRLPDSLRNDAAAVADLPVPVIRQPAQPTNSNSESSPRSFVPFSSVANIHVTTGLNEIGRINGKRHVTITCNVRGRDIGSFVAEARAKVNDAVPLPGGNWVEWGGQFQNLVSARARLAIVVPIALFLIFVLLFGTFGSFKHAVLVFSGVPLAMTGGVAALYLRHIPFSISAGVGFIALSGVAVLNGLVIVTFINQLRRQSTPLDDAISQASLTRLRPVLMTALVASLGFLPMALARGAGAEVQRPLATVVIGGVISSTFLTLIALPAFYRLTHLDRAPSAPTGDSTHSNLAIIDPSNTHPQSAL